MMKFRAIAMFFVLSLVLGAVCFAADTAPAAAAPDKKFGQEEGEFVRPVSLKAAEGDQVVKTDELKNVSLFMMVSSVCTACRLELDEVASNLKEFGGKVDVYAVIIDMDPKVAVERMKDKVAGITMLSDSDYALGRNVNLISAPSAVMLDKEGKIILKKSGYRSGQWKDYVRIMLK